jgi:hypothetical protein
MRYAWLAIIVVSIVPVAYASLLLNPLVFFFLGSAGWWERVARLYPYRWWFAASLVALVLGTAVYAIQYA